MPKQAADTVIVLDFETTGLSPDNGDRAIEIGAVLIQNGEVVDSFQRLMNPGRRVNSFIENYTGISNAMLKDADGCAQVMAEFCDFIGDYNLVAHNASFDRRFLDAELAIIDRQYGGDFACSMLIARRLYQQAPNHKLGGLVEYKNLPTEGVFHRALADAEMTARLWLQMLEDIAMEYDKTDLTFRQVQKLAKIPKAGVASFLQKL
ncbi:3'-5' exonuclease [Amphritea balenae]|uniref:DNA-directed DNA polymerase n=1 Tax=Amphritea balenae TaxID=452629 RepID=A0A3P1SR81_9GAMM|nr:3'-5' exonuclease [Amphritea balenae]RRC99657.1 3'-5' exonuclease [Amphritea balenae]GGK78733.1 DNA polymerase III subunit epsilon [Amphritea balenae]